MSTLYPINNVYKCIQGEGCLTGMAMTLVRMHGCGVGCVFCLPGFASILVYPGKKTRLDEVKIGDKVAGWDGKQVVWNEVLDTISREAVELVRLQTERNSTNRATYVTPEHPFYVPKRGGWINAGNLCIGDELFGLSSSE